MLAACCCATGGHRTALGKSLAEPRMRFLCSVVLVVLVDLVVLVVLVILVVLVVLVVVVALGVLVSLVDLVALVIVVVVVVAAVVVLVVLEVVVVFFFCIGCQNYVPNMPCLNERSPDCSSVLETRGCFQDSLVL